jgi:hypothetical protein
MLRPCHDTESASSAFPTAARGRSAPQLYIKGKTPLPSAALRDRAHDGKVWLAVTAIKLMHDV